MRPTYEDLQEQLRDARERLAEATGQNLAGAMAEIAGSTHLQSRVLAMLYTCPDVVSVPLIWSEAFADPATGDGPMMETVKVRICDLRKRLRDRGAPEGIVNVAGFGYRLSGPLRDWIRARLQPVAVAA